MKGFGQKSEAADDFLIGDDGSLQANGSMPFRTGTEASARCMARALGLRSDACDEGIEMDVGVTSGSNDEVSDSDGCAFIAWNVAFPVGFPADC